MKSVPFIDITNYKEIAKEIEKEKENLAKAVNATINESKKRGYSWINQEVTQVYTIKKKDLKSDQKSAMVKGKTKVFGVKVDNVAFRYKGRLLTPIHFKMTPKNKPKKKRYRIKTEIIRGRKKNLPRGVFLVPTGTKQIPFQREGKERLPINSIKTLSIPQMITNKNTEEKIQERINVELDKRLEHHINRFNKKNK